MYIFSFVDADFIIAVVIFRIYGNFQTLFACIFVNLRFLI